MNKREVREELQTKRALISQERRLHAETALASSHFPHLVLSFYSFGTEINTLPLNKNLSKRGKLALPKIVGEDLHFYIVENLETDLEQENYPFLEPSPKKCLRFLFNAPCYLLVPGLGFDKNHFRIGYGRGYYDRLLQAYPHLRSVGVGFHEQKVDRLPLDPHDQALFELALF